MRVALPPRGAGCGSVTGGATPRHTPKAPLSFLLDALSAAGVAAAGAGYHDARHPKGGDMRIGVLASVAHRTPPRDYGPWEQVASTLTEGFVAARSRRHACTRRRTR